MKTLHVLFLMVMLSGCAAVQEKPAVEKVVYVSTPLSAPPHSVLPTVSSQELQCLPPDVKQRLLDRDRLLHSDRDTYEAIIKSTQKNR